MKIIIFATVVNAVKMHIESFPKSSHYSLKYYEYINSLLVS